MFAKKIINFKTEKNALITYDYGYEIMKNIYSYISEENPELEKFLHDEGFYASTGQKFKAFNHTLHFSGANFNEKGISLNNSSLITLILSGKKDLLEYIINGLFRKQILKIGNTELQLVNIKNDKKVSFQNVMRYKAVSPIVTSIREGNRIKYLSPYEVDKYFRNLAFNAMRKYEAVFGKPYEGEIYFDIDNAFLIKEKMFGIKEGKVKGYKYDIWVEADPNMQKVLYYLGIGEKNSIGFGNVSWYPESR